MELDFLKMFVTFFCYDFFLVNETFTPLFFGLFIDSDSFLVFFIIPTKKDL